MTEQMISADGAQLCLETFGDRHDPAVLLIGGAAMSMDWWEPDFCRRIADAGRLVIRYDHRDTGRSSAAPAGAPDYSSTDLFTDPVRILDALDLERVHLAGLSMGGGIAQVLARQYPDRVASLTLMSTSPAGERASTEPLPGPEPRVLALFQDPRPAPDWTDRAAVVAHIVEGCRVYAGGLGFDADQVREVAERMIERSRDIAAGQQNHWILTGESPSFRMADLALPTLVLHGTDDPFFPLPHGAALAAEIADATFVQLEGMGHEVPPRALWDVVVPAIVEHTGP
jgi:pimeloyl-ACP methyl ester carboxylesterase